LYGVYRHESRIKNHPLFLRNRSFIALRALTLYHTSSPSQNLSPCNSLNRNYSLRYQEFSMHFSILIFQSIDIFTYPSKRKKFDRKYLVKIYVICQVSMAARLRLRLLYKLISVPCPTLGNRNKPSINPFFFSSRISLFLFRYDDAIYHRIVTRNSSSWSVFNKPKEREPQLQGKAEMHAVEVLKVCGTACVRRFLSYAPALLKCWSRTVDADASKPPQKAAWIVCDGVVVDGMWKWMGPGRRGNGSGTRWLGWV